MRKKIIPITLGVLVFSMTICQAWPGWLVIPPGSLVIDIRKLTEQIIVTAKRAAIVKNNKRIIANEVKDLISMDFKALVLNQVNINNSGSEFLQALQDIQGLAVDIKNAEKSWNDAFVSVRNIGDLSAAEQIAHSESMARVLSKTYRDTFKTQGIVSQIAKDQEDLQKLMQANSDAVGEKAVEQTGNQIAAMAVLQRMRQQEILASVARASVAEKAASIQTDMMAKESTYQQINTGAADPYKSDDKYTRSTGQGFIHF